MNSGLHSATQISTNPACWLGLASPISHTILRGKHQPRAEFELEGCFGGLGKIEWEQRTHSAGGWTVH